MNHDEKPRIVDRWQLCGSFQPFLAEQVRLYGFVFPADEERLKDLCQRYLNEPSDNTLDYKPLLPLVLVTFARAGRLASERAPYDHVGWAAETEATFWVFVARLRDGFIPARLAWFVPYIFVDLPLAISQGREIYGFPKEIGYFESPSTADWFHSPADGPQADRFALGALAVDRFDPRSEFRPRPLLEITREPSSAAAPEPPWRRFADAASVLRSIVAEVPHFKASVAASVMEKPLEFLDLHLWPPGGTIALLKQFSSVANGAIASFQSIVEARAEVTGFRGGGLLHGPFTLQLDSLQSHPIENDLGLAPHTTTVASYWLDFDFRLDAGKNVWSA